MPLFTDDMFVYVKILKELTANKTIWIKQVAVRLLDSRLIESKSMMLLHIINEQKYLLLFCSYGIIEFR